MILDELYMKHCLDLALQGIRSVAPNPMVGAVIVHNDRIIGEGFHREFGKAHAEVNAIESVKDPDLLKQSTLYVNLEPCVHFGKTPPCTDLIIHTGIPRVVIGMVDPNTKVAGKGIERLKNAGCEVKLSMLENEAGWLNRRFFTFHKLRRPYIILKWAQTSDGFIDKKRNAGDPVEPNWITDDLCRTLVHRWRTEEQAILIGNRTALTDNPSLTARLWTGKQPLKAVLDRNNSLPGSLNIFHNESPLIIFNSLENNINGHIRRVKINFDQAVQSMLDVFYSEEIQSVIVEGGAMLLNSFIRANLWDEARVFTSPILFQEGIKGPEIKADPHTKDEIGNSLLTTYFNPASLI